MTKKRNATIATPPIAPRESISSKNQEMIDQATALRAVFMNMAVEMSWQLALVVIVPIVGGHMLDVRYGTTPWLTFGGLALAITGAFGVLRRVLSEANRRSNDVSKPKRASS
jgi:F0F1-type ATP synthase assembly protein I